MNTVKEYKMPLIIVGAALVVLLVLWVALVSPENSNLSSLQAQSTTLQTREAGLQAKLTALRSEGHKLSSNCVALEKITTQIPSVENPTDLDAEESSFESQFNTLAGSADVSLAQFGGFTPAATTASPAASAAATAGDVVAVPTTLTIQGTFAQVTKFIDGLDSFPRLFVIQKFTFSFGIATTAGSTGNSSSSSAEESTTGQTANVSTPPLWVGGTTTSPTSGPYNLSITGSIFYTSTPSALAACNRAAAVETSLK